MSPLDKIKRAGFDVWLESVDGLADRLLIHPSDKLTDEQLAYLKANKQAIINELLMTRVYTPNGCAFVVLASNVEHKAFLQRMNPLPTWLETPNYEPRDSANSVRYAHIN